MSDVMSDVMSLFDQMKKEEEKQEALDQRWELTGEETEERLLEWKQQMEIKPIYRCIVIDPPWPMKKIRREVRPKQVEMDYKTMSIDEIKEFPLKKFMHNDGCHIYLWTTQKFLRDSFDVFEAWGVKFQCLMTWVKNVGFTPYSWMYSTEHVLFGACGNIPLLRKGIRLDFNAKVREHSRKPDEFYDIVRLVSSGPRVDIFSREKREGFDVWGYETEKFTERSLNYYR